MQDKGNTAVPASVKKLEITLPEIKDLLSAGVQFGHQTHKWNPKMKEFIFTSKNKIHILDLTKTSEKLKEALEFLYQSSKRGSILFVGTKRQAAEIVKNAAVESGSHFVTNRWPGGLLTNFKLIQKSIKRLNKLEEDFEKGVANRTKFEISQQKKEWEKSSRIYEGVKTMERFPVAVVIVDTKFERLAVREAKTLGIPIVAMVDTNCDPTIINYPVPANDDAIRSITLVMNMFAKAVKEGNEGRGVKHVFKDYSTAEIQVIKKDDSKEKEAVQEVTAVIKEEQKIAEPFKPTKATPKQKGILESIQENKSGDKKVVKQKAAPIKPAVVEIEKAAKTTKPAKAVKEVKKAKTAVKKVVKKVK
jgi:small subunit ribosomal protein S2